MNKKPLVSICCLAFNHKNFISKCLDSFLMQKTDFPFEVLVHDDASTDGTTEIIRAYQNKYPDVIKPIFQTTNQYSKGVSVTTTYNFPRAEGKYIAMCEGDDYWTDPDKLQIQMDLLERHNLGFSFHAAEIRNYGRQEIIKDRTSYYYGDKIRVFSLTDIIDKNGRNIRTPVASFFFKREYIDKLRNEHPDFYSNSISHSFLVLWLATCTKVLYVPKFMSVYRLDHGQSWNSRMKNDVSFKKRYNLRVINSYNEFNKITKYQFNKLFKRNINNRILSVLKDIKTPLVERERFYLEVYTFTNFKNRLIWSLILRNKIFHRFVLGLFKIGRKI